MNHLISIPTRGQVRIGRLWLFASRRCIGVQARTRHGYWQGDFCPGPWRVFSYRRGIRKPGQHYIDLGRIGIFRWGPIGKEQP